MLSAVAQEFEWICAIPAQMSALVFLNTDGSMVTKPREWKSRMLILSFYFRFRILYLVVSPSAIRNPADSPCRGEWSRLFDAGPQ